MTSSDNRFTPEVIRGLNAVRRLLGNRAHYERARLAQQCRGPLNLLDRLEAGARDVAATILRRHLDGARTNEFGALPRPTAAPLPGKP